MSAETDSQSKGIKTLTFSVNSIGDNNLVAAVAGQRVYILGMTVSSTGGNNTVVLEDTGGAVKRSPTFVTMASEVHSWPVTPPGRWWDRTAEGAGLDINLSAAMELTGTLVFQQF